MELYLHSPSTRGAQIRKKEALLPSVFSLREADTVLQGKDNSKAKVVPVLD
jgi:hypothetical protein